MLIFIHGRHGHIRVHKERMPCSCMAGACMHSGHVFACAFKRRCTHAYIHTGAHALAGHMLTRAYYYVRVCANRLLHTFTDTYIHTYIRVLCVIQKYRLRMCICGCNLGSATTQRIIALSVGIVHGIAGMYVCMHAYMYVCIYVCNVYMIRRAIALSVGIVHGIAGMYVCMHVCMYT
jgi:hypothetical protein